MGEVWQGVHIPTGTPTAVKLMRAAGQGRAWAAAFRNEVRAAASLDHPNVIRLFDHGITGDDTHWLAMELAEGSLETGRGRTSWAVLLPLLRDVLDGLGHAHARRVVHRDVKPANVLLVKGRAKLGDFGIAQARDTAEGEAAGTPRYMAPEQAWGRAGDVGPWTDLYAFGCLVWAMLTGHPPPVGAWAPRLQATVPVPAETEGWLRAVLVRDPAPRPAFAADVRAGLDELEIGRAHV